ncbi:flagellar basal body-associated protein FliL [Virgibacillus sediminis]|uniref:Flagellar protein FliL n=1 Tax=Virgibacillus sediminis TaxID=202260 RepID=A0ABV7AAH4_9BACI
MNKIWKAMVFSFAILGLGGALAAATLLYLHDRDTESEAESIDEMIEFAYESPEITTDLKDGSFVRIQFQILADSKDAKKELEKREFQIKNVMIKEMAEKQEEDFRSGLAELEDSVETSLNELMTDGQVSDVYTTSKILQ